MKNCLQLLLLSHLQPQPVNPPSMLLWLQSPQLWIWRQRLALVVTVQAVVVQGCSLHLRNPSRKIVLEELHSCLHFFFFFFLNFQPHHIL
jgi:hypothetical protein